MQEQAQAGEWRGEVSTVSPKVVFGTYDAMRYLRAAFSCTALQGGEWFVPFRRCRTVNE